MNTHVGNLDDAVMATAQSYDPAVLGHFIANAQHTARCFLSEDFATASIEQLFGQTSSPLDAVAYHHAETRQRGAKAVSVRAEGEEIPPSMLSHLATPQVPDARPHAPGRDTVTEKA